MNENDIFFQSVTQAYSEKEIPSAAIRRTLVSRCSWFSVIQFTNYPETEHSTSAYSHFVKKCHFGKNKFCTYSLAMGVLQVVGVLLLIAVVNLNTK